MRSRHGTMSPGTVLADAVKLATESDVVVLCVGLNEELEGEATDRDDTVAANRST